MQGGDPRGGGRVHGQASGAATVGAGQVGHLGGDALGLLVDPVAGQEVGERSGCSDLVHVRVVGRQKLAVGVVEEHKASVGPHEGVAGLVVEMPDLHVRGVGGVHDVHGVEQEDPVHVGQHQLVGDAVQPVAHHGRLVRKDQASGCPLGQGRLAGPHDHPVADGRRPAHQRVVQVAVYHGVSVHRPILRSGVSRPIDRASASHPRPRRVEQRLVTASGGASDPQHFELEAGSRGRGVG